MRVSIAMGLALAVAVLVGCGQGAKTGDAVGAFVSEGAARTLITQVNDIVARRAQQEFLATFAPDATIEYVENGVVTKFKPSGYVNDFRERYANLPEYRFVPGDMKIATVGSGAEVKQFQTITISYGGYTTDIRHDNTYFLEMVGDQPKIKMLKVAASVFRHTRP